MSELQGPSADFANATVKNGSPWARLPKAEVAVRRPAKLDSDQSKNLFRRLMGYYMRELRRQETNRFEQAMDEDFFDNVQWDAADAQAVKDRGQIPIVYNVLSSTINWITGTEKRSRTDFRVLPRRKDQSKPAERKSQLLKYLSDVNRSPFTKSRAFEDCAKVGVGWLEAGVQSDDDGEPVYDRYESWRNMLWDSAATEMDLTDARYIFRVKWVDEDVLNAMFPKRRGIIAESVVASESFVQDSSEGDDAMDSIEEQDGSYRTDLDDAIYSRRRVRVIECWYRAPVDTLRVKGGDFSGEAFDETSAAHAEEVESGKAAVVRTTMMRMHVAIFTRVGLLHLSESPYRHNRFPFTPIWCFRRGRNNLPYGVIRGLRDIQQDVNKRASKALAIISTNKTVMDEGAVPDIEEFREEVSRPDAVIVKRKNHELTLNVDRDLAPAHIEMMSRSIALIQSVSGVTDENMGRTTNARSGIAIQARQNQGALATSGLFDNLRFANQVHGEKMLSLVEQYYDEEKAFRITNMRGTPEYITVNDGLPENDIARSKADFIISEDDWRATVRQAQTAELIELLMQLAPVAPQIVIVMIDLVIEKMDIPNRDEIVRRIRQATGMRDPDAEEPTPEELAQAEAKAKADALQQAGMEAEIAAKQAEAAEKAARAEKTTMEAKKVLASIAKENAETQRAALETALQMIAAPVAVPVADGVLHEAGFRSRTEMEDDAMLTEALQRKAEEEAAAQQQAEQIPAQGAPQEQMGGEQGMPPEQGAMQ